MTVEEMLPAGNARLRATPLRSPDARVTLHWATRDADAARAGELEAILSGAERARAARFGAPGLRARYIVGRATLRAILAARLGTSASDVAIVRGRRGRPRLAGHDGIDFNVTHTGDVMLVAIARGVVLGVDVERADRAINVSGIARRCLTSSERGALAALGPDAARREVLRWWTCKEAMSKATGDGLAAPFRDLDIDLAGSAPVLLSGPAPYTPARWALHALGVPDGFLATLALWSVAPRAG